jgi:hypothetical protein
MNPQGLADELNELLATETRSLARHLDEAKPYLTPQTYRAWNQIKHYGQLSVRHAQRLSNLIDELKLRAGTRPYPLEVANYHFMRLDFMLPKLIEEKSRQIGAFERALTHADDDDRVVAELSDLLNENREQLAQLEALVPPEVVKSNGPGR